MHRRLFAWWVFAEGVVLCLTNPRTDPGARDVSAFQAIATSRVFASADATVAAVERAWDDSRVRAAVAWSVRSVEHSTAGRIRQAGTSAAVAAVTVLGLQPLESEAGPLRWLLPL